MQNVLLKTDLSREAEAESTLSVAILFLDSTEEENLLEKYSVCVHHMWPQASFFFFSP